MITIEPLLSHSFRDFHAPGVDYICLLRTPSLTIKLYLFDGMDRPITGHMEGNEDRPFTDVICPHNHRYNFLTTCVRGEVINRTYDLGWDYTDEKSVAIEQARNWRRYTEYLYATPLNGGDGFREPHPRLLRTLTPMVYGPSDTYFMSRHDLHTISVQQDTILLLFQFADAPNVGSTSTFFPEGVSPADLSTLYSRFTAQELHDRLEPIWPLLEPYLTPIAYTS